MDAHQKSVESQLHTRCDILESQVEALKKQNLTLRIKEHIAKGLPPLKSNELIDDLPFKVKMDEWKEIQGVGKFPKNYKPDSLGFD